MELDIIKSQTTWNDAVGGINSNFAKIKAAFATVGTGGGGGLNEDELRLFLEQNGYTTENWVKLQKYLTAESADLFFARKEWVEQQIAGIDLSPYAKSTDVANTYATISALNTLEGKHDALRNEFDALSNLLSSDTTDYINTWNEVVAFLDGYKDESDLATILSGMNADISLRLLASDFESWKTNTFIPHANLVTNHTTRLDGLDQSILSINTRIDGVDTTIEDHIAEFIAFRDNFEITDNLILVKKNFASTKEISAHGINQGNGGGGSSFSRLDAWADYDSNKAGYVLSALLGYDLHSRVTVLENKEVDLSNYYTKGQTDNRISAAISKIDFTPYATNDALSELGEDVQLRLLSSEFATWETNTFTPLAIRVSQAKEDIDTNATNIAKANNNISTLDALTKQHSTKIAANEENIGTKADQSSLDAAVKDIATNAEDIVKANKNISDLDSLTKEHTSQISGLDTLTKQHASQITSLDTLTKQHTTKINGLETLTSTHTSQISGLETRVTVAEGNIANHDSEIDNLDKRIKTFESWFELVDGNIKTTFNFYSTKQISALGLEAGNGGGGSSYSRLDSWSAYDSSKAGYVLSALLGQDLNTRLIAVENKEVDLTGYYTKAQTDAKISSAVGAIDFTPYAKSADVAKTYATIAALNLIDGRVGNLEKAGYATTGYVDAAISGIDFSPYATTEELNEAIEGIDLTPFAKSADVALTYATKNELTASINGLSISQYAKSSDVEATYATKEALTSAINGLNISQYATTAALGKAISDLNISQYAKSTDVASTYATIAALNGLTSLHNNLRSEFDALNSLLNDDTAGVIDTWNEVVNFINEYSGSDDLETILAGMNKNIDLRLLASDFNAWVANTYTPLAYRVGVAEENIGKNATAIANNKSDIDKLLGWFKIDSDGNVYTEHNFYSTQQISAKGLNAGGGSGSSYNRLDAWTDYDSNKAGYVLSASLGYGLKVAIDELNGYDLDNRVRSIENSYVSKDAGGVVNGGLVVSSLAIAGGSSSQFLKADGSLDGTSYLSTRGGVISGDLTINGYLINDGHFLFARNTDGAEWIVTDRNWQHNYDILHSGNVGDYAPAITANQWATSAAFIGEVGTAYITYRGGSDWSVTDNEWRNEYTLYHSGNFNPSGYLPTIGGVITGDPALLTFRVPRIGADAWLQFTDTETSDIYAIGLRRPADMFGLQYKINDDYYDILHQGNIGDYAITPSTIGSQSVAYASNAGGIQGSTSSINFALGHNRLEMINNPSSYMGDFASAYQSGISVITEYVGWQMTSYGGDIENPYFRSLEDTGRWKPWRQIAFLDDNVASATKLQTPRTIWGQSFDGTGNVDGNMHTSGEIFLNHNKSIRLKGSDEINYNALFTSGTDLNIGYDSPVIRFGGSKMYLNSAGNVGIGTTDPKEKLDVDSTFRVFNATNDICLLVSSTASHVMRLASLNTAMSAWYAMSLGYNNQLYLNPASTKNNYVGINTDNPIYQLHVDGTGYFSGALTANGGLTVNGILTVGGASIHPTANNPYFQLYQNNNYWYWQADNSNTYIGGTMSKALRIDQDGNTLIRGSLGVTGDATANRLVVGTDGISCNGPATFNDFIYGSSITPRTDNYYVLGNNNYKWYAVTAYNVNVHDAITIEAGKELRFKDDNGVVHTLKYDSAKQAFVFDGNVNATGEISAKKLNA